MIEILDMFSIYQIIVYTIMLALAIKGGIDFYIWVRERYEEKFNKDYSKKKKADELEQHYINCSEQHKESIQCYQQLDNKLDKMANRFEQQVRQLETQVSQLIDSDMHDIKSWIVEKHHHYIKKGWVDDFTMDTIEYRFADYRAENGNSYVEGLVNELRALPHVPPEQEKEE